ncbi:hypothetical protein [Leucobacter chromiireducens]|uniref:hypothetical protein n=1 Tax=Leucobacter chromiireducens TaxID=283877 RepID=UPI000F62ED67|nr:hypothetical protein [Leucobacter chromiireducens]
MALSAHIPPGAFFTHRTAATLWRLPVSPPEVHPDRLDLAAFGQRPGIPRAGIASRSLSPRLANVVTRHGTRLTDPASTWALLAPGLSRLEAIALGDAILHESRRPGTNELRSPPLATPDQLWAALAVPYRRYRPRLRALFAELSRHAASPPESHLRLLLRQWDFPAPSLDHDVWDPHGHLLGNSEIAFPDQRLALEYEGAHHFSLAKQYARDIEKAQLYAEHGWTILRVTAELLYRRPETLRQRIGTALTQGMG